MNACHTYRLRKIYTAAAITTLLWALPASCIRSTDDAGYSEDERQISFIVRGEDMIHGTRAATAFPDREEQPDRLTTSHYGGGSFTVSAYIDGTETPYIDSAWVWYSAGWHFREGDDYEHIQYFWPHTSKKLNFFAYMPAFQNTDVFGRCGVNDITYTDADGPMFSCTLPLTKDDDHNDSTMDQDHLQEFIYAFEENLDRRTRDGYADIMFTHPFAVIWLKLKRAHHDLKINHVSFTRIYSQGRFTHSSTTPVKWEPTGSRGDLTLTVNRRVPDELQHNTVIDGPFIVMPQDIAVTGPDSALLTVNYDYDNNVEIEQVTGKDISIPLPAPDDRWLPGYAYTYVLDLGDNNDTIKFKVEVEGWKLQSRQYLEVE